MEEKGGGEGRAAGAARPAAAPRPTPSRVHTHPHPPAPRAPERLQPGPGSPGAFGARGCLRAVRCPVARLVPLLTIPPNQLEFGQLRGGPDVTRGHVAPPPAGSLSRK